MGATLFGIIFRPYSSFGVNVLHVFVIPFAPAFFYAFQSKARTGIRSLAIFADIDITIRSFGMHIKLIDVFPNSTLFTCFIHIQVPSSSFDDLLWWGSVLPSIRINYGSRAGNRIHRVRYEWQPWFY